MANILRVASASPWRISVVFDSAPTTTTTDYVLTRQDGLTDGAITNYVFFTGTNVVDLALNQQLSTDSVYLLSYQGGTQVALSYRQPANPNLTPTVGQDDPEAEAYGIDIDWFADSLTAAGDVPLIHGLQCLRNDLAATALTFPGEIFHRPDVGAGMQTRVNGPNLPQQLDDIRATLKRTWATDDRVIPGGIDISVDSSVSGQITATAKVQTVAILDPIVVKTPGSS